MEEQEEIKNRVRRYNVFEHYHEGFQPHALPNPPMVIQSFKEYKERSHLEPKRGNLWGCFWNACSVKEKGFWEAALEHNKIYSLMDDSKVYHPITFGEDNPDYRPRGDEMPKDRPKDNDQRFCYHSDVKLWKTTQVVEERSLRVASDKVRLWLDAVQNTCPDIRAEFPPSQVEANQATAAAKASGKGARKRQSSVPPGSDTAKAKQARSMAEEKGKKGGKGKGRIPSIPKQALAATAAALADKVSELYPSLRPKDRRTIQSQAHDWYKAIYHTRFHMTKSQYLDCLCDTAIRFLDVKEPDSKFKEVMTKAFTSLKALVDNPTTAGLPNPNQAPSVEPIGQKRPAATSTSQGNLRIAKAKMGTYADAAIGKSTSLTLPIGAKSAPPKTPAKFASGAIGAPVPPKGKPKAKAKSQGDKTPIGASSTAKQGTAKRNEPPITSETALEFLKNAPPLQSFADYQTTQDTSADPDAPEPQTVQDDQTPRDDHAAQDDQTEQDEQIARAVQADLDAQAARDETAPQSGQDGNLPDLNDDDDDDDDDAIMQQVLVQSRQTAQPHGSDPQATSSAGAAQSTEQELQRELELGIEYQTEVQTLQLKMSQARLTSDEVARYRTVSQLSSANQARVAELCERQVQESMAQTSRNTRAILGSIQPLNPARPKGPTIKPPPSSRDTTGACPTPAPGPMDTATGPEKGTTSCAWEAGYCYWPEKGTTSNTGDESSSGGHDTTSRNRHLHLQRDKVLGQNHYQFKTEPRNPASPKATTQSHLIGKIVSPRGNPPPRILPRSNNPSRPSSVADGHTPTSARSEATAVLEEKLRRKKELKRARTDEEHYARADERDPPRHHGSRHQRQEHRPSRDTRRRNRTPSQDSSSSDSRRRIEDHPHQEAPGLEDMGTRGAIGHGPVGARDLTRRRRGSSDKGKRSRSKRREGEHRSSKDRRRRGSLLFITRTGNCRSRGR